MCSENVHTLKEKENTCKRSSKEWNRKNGEKTGKEMERKVRAEMVMNGKGTEKIKKKCNIIGSKMARNPTERNG